MRAFTFAALLLLAPDPSMAQSGAILFEVGHVFAAGPMARSAAGYVSLKNAGTAPDRLTSARSPAARMTQVHRTEIQDGVARMRPVEGLEVAPGETVELAPGGLHLMLMGLTAPLGAGDVVEITLVFEQAGEILLRLPVETVPGAAADGGPGG